jgi:uncharacterized protein (TIGR02996 family)
MNAERTLEEALHADPADEAGWLALADCLEEQGQAERAELLRLRHGLTRAPGGLDRPAREARLRELILAGVRPAAVELVNTVKMRLALIPPGSFVMGSPEQEEGRRPDEVQHLVTLTRGFYLGVFPVTQREWRKVMGTNPARFRSATHPVENVTWDDCREFCARLSESEGRPYRLPSEVEWEYACRAGTSTAYHAGDDLAALRRVAWRVYPSGGRDGRSGPVGRFLPNAFGLFDVHGNVLEFCADWYGPYPGGEPLDPEVTPGHVLRGGGWHNHRRYCRSASRLHLEAPHANDCVGFRVCREVG